MVCERLRSAANIAAPVPIVRCGLLPLPRTAQYSTVQYGTQHSTQQYTALPLQPSSPNNHNTAVSRIMRPQFSQPTLPTLALHTLTAPLTLRHTAE